MSESKLADRGGAVRRGEELDAAAVTAWLRTQGLTLDGAPEITQFSGGASNWTYRLRYANADLILRRPPAGTKAKSAHDMGREYRVQAALKPVYPQVPEMLAYCRDTSVIGDEFYVMQRIEGVIPRAQMPRGVELSPQAARQLCLNVIDKLVELHRVDVAVAGLGKLGKGSGYCRRQIDGWSERFAKAATWNVWSARPVIGWLKANVPDDIATCVIHGDFRLDNLVLDRDDPTRVIGVLDWEMATLGDPLMDLGNSLAYWIQADDNFMMRMLRRQPTWLPGMLTRREVVDYYCARMQLKPASFAFYEVYGLFRLSVILQQIYYRYHHRQTRNPAFRNFWLMANYLNLRGLRIIRQQTK